MTTDAPLRPERLALSTADGLRLRAEWLGTGATAENASTPTVVLCHPHPLHGGNMHATVIDRLFHTLPTHRVPTLRFNFRGVQGSDGKHDHGNRERFDVMAAIDFAAERRPEAVVRLIGWSFGADVALGTPHPALDGWIGIAPPLRVIDPGDMVAAADPRPSDLLVGEHDAFRPPSEARELTSDWVSTTVTEIGGADHFFGGALPALVDEVIARLPAI